MKAKSRAAEILAAGLGVAGLGFCFAGKYLQKLYGLDPPYIYFEAGTVLELAGLLCLIVWAALLLYLFWRKFRKRNKLS